MLAICYKRHKIIEAIVQKLDHIHSLITHRDTNDETALALAIAFGMIPLSLTLLHKGATLYSKNKANRDPISAIMDLKKRAYVVDYYIAHRDRIPHDEMAIVFQHKHDLEIVDVVKYMILLQHDPTLKQRFMEKNSKRSDFGNNQEADEDSNDKMHAAMKEILKQKEHKRKAGLNEAIAVNFLGPHNQENTNRKESFGYKRKGNILYIIF